MMYLEDRLRELYSRCTLLISLLATRVPDSAFTFTELMQTFHFESGDLPLLYAIASSLDPRVQQWIVQMKRTTEEAFSLV